MDRGIARHCPYNTIVVVVLVADLAVVVVVVDNEEVDVVLVDNLVVVVVVVDNLVVSGVVVLVVAYHAAADVSSR